MRRAAYGARARHCRWLIVSAAFTFVATAPVLAQSSASQPGGTPEDWTHHHVAFGDAGTAEQAIHNGTFGEWLKTVNDPRYQLQRAKRIAAAQSKTTLGVGNAGADADGESTDAPAESAHGIGISLAAPPQLPRGLTKASSTFAGKGADGSAIGDLEFDAASRFPRAPKKWSHNDQKVDWSETLGSGGSLGQGNYPAKYSFSTSTASCSDWIVYPTGLPGGSAQATIIAFTNLYSGTCGASIPSVSWAFNTGTSSTILTSPVLSLDGTQIAFVQNNSGGGASLVVLKWSATGTLTAPDTLANQASGSAYRSCAAPCMFAINFSGGASDSGSSAWYDYGLDTVWVGDDNGVLHKFTGVFSGSPAEVTSGWPASVSASPLSSPIRDSATGNVFVGDYNLTTASACSPSASTSNNPCGFLYSYNSSTGAPNAKSAQLDFNFGIVDSPLLDSFAGNLYVPVGSDGEIGSSTKCGTATPCAGIFQLSTSFSGGAAGTEVTVGPGYQPLLTGALDNTYLTSANAASPTGHMYVVGNTGPANNTLYQVTIAANVMSTTSVTGPVVAQNFTNGFFASGLNVTEFFNSATDYIFLSTIAFSNYTGCGTPPSIGVGCVVGFNVTSGSISSSTPPTGSSPAAGGASGIIVDNSGAATGESNIYFSALSNQTCPTSGGTSGCAIQISQSAP
jgi:hypothetical protein